MFNFNPFNYYQTPLERYNGTVLANLDLSENAEVYSMFNYGKTKVAQQVAPSGVFGTGIFTPLANPLIGAQARAAMIIAAAAGRTRGARPTARVSRTRRRRTRRVLTTGPTTTATASSTPPTICTSSTADARARSARAPRSTTTRCSRPWSACAARSRTTGTTTCRSSTARRIACCCAEGYTNLTNFENALQTTDGVTCANGDATCVPINVFGGYGSITPAMAAYSGATALQQQDYDQLIGQAFVTGSFENLQLPRRRARSRSASASSIATRARA